MKNSASNGYYSTKRSRSVPNFEEKEKIFEKEFFNITNNLNYLKHQSELNEEMEMGSLFQ